MTKTVLTALILMLASVTAQAAGNPENGQLLAEGCQGCHGADGNSPVGMWPSLAGQSPNYLIKQINDFKNGVRKNETMEPMVAAFNDQEIADIAAYFSSQKATATGTVEDEGLVTLGKKIYKGGNHESKLMACAGCHGANAQGNDAAKFPSLIGQQAEYVLVQLQNFGTGERSNDMNSMMKDIADRMSTKEMEAVAAYLATLSQ